MAKGQPQDQVLSTKNLLFSSWDLEYMKRMACGKNLSDPGEEKRGPSAPHTYHFCSLEGSESWSPSGGKLLSRFSRVRLCATPWTAAYQASPSMGFFRQE